MESHWLEPIQLVSGARQSLTLTAETHGPIRIHPDELASLRSVRVNRQAPVRSRLGDLGLGGLLLLCHTPWRGTDVKPRAITERLDEQQAGSRLRKAGKNLVHGRHHSGRKSGRLNQARAIGPAVASAAHHELDEALWASLQPTGCCRPLQKPKREAKASWYPCPN